MKENVKVLIIEDEEEIRSFLKMSLEQDGFSVDAISNPNPVPVTLKSLQPDIVLLDQKLPEKHGLDILKEIRQTKEFKHLPVIMVTGLGSEQERLVAFSQGADDYVTKPFYSSEISARIRAVMKRVKGQSPLDSKQEVTYKDVRLDFVSHKVFLAEKEIALTLTEFKILNELISHSGRVLPREYLREKVLGKANVTDRTIDVHVAALRKKLEHRGRDILTVRGVGYRLF